MVVIDTREQRPYDFPCECVHHALPAGDYSILGFERRVAVERKRPCELFHCFGSDRARFEREYQRLALYDYAAVVIEGHIDTCATRYDPHSSVSPHVVINSLISWDERYGVRFHFAGDRDMARGLTYRLLQQFHRQHLLEGDSSSSFVSKPAESAEPRREGGQA